MFRDRHGSTDLIAINVTGSRPREGEAREVAGPVTKVLPMLLLLRRSSGQHGDVPQADAH